MIKTIVTHKNCPDGKASVIILKTAFPEAKVIFVQHGTDEYRNLQAEEGMLFCDISPPEERVEEFIQVGSIVLDHHESAKSVVEKFEEKGHYSDEPGISGAWLAYRFITGYPVLGYALAKAKFFATFIGIIDTWEKDSLSWQDALELHTGVGALSEAEVLETDLSNLDLAFLSRMGRTVLRRNSEKEQETLNRVWIKNIDDLNVGFINESAPSHFREKLNLDLMVSFHIFKSVDQDDRPKIVLSFRSDPSKIHCGKLCQFLKNTNQGLNGGGHSGAGSCSFKYAEIRSFSIGTIDSIITEMISNFIWRG